FVTCAEAAHHHDMQVRYLAGRQAPGEPEDSLSRAKRHLEDFALVGLTERFDESVLQCARVLGWRNVFYAKQNENNRRPPGEAIPGVVRELIRERSARDVELYEWVADRFARSMAQQPIPVRQLRAFAAVNRVYHLTSRITGLPRALLADARTAIRRRA